MKIEVIPSVEKPGSATGHWFNLIGMGGFLIASTLWPLVVYIEGRGHMLGKAYVSVVLDRWLSKPAAL